MKLSVIIPCYNGAAYIERCIGSFVGQTDNDFELIVVDDGSTDGSLALLRRLESVLPWLRVVSQANAGVSSARNCGMDHARGEFLTFVDIDDWVDHDYIANITKYTLTYPLALGIGELDSGISGEIGKMIPASEGIEMTNLPAHGHAWGKIVNTSIVKTHNIHFPHDIRYKEDLLFYLNYLKYAPGLYLIGKIGYNYDLHEGSLSTSWKAPAELNRINSRIATTLRSSFPEAEQALGNFEAYCITETLYNYNLTPARLRRNSDDIRQLRGWVSTADYPIIYKTDRMLDWLWSRRMMTAFTVVQDIAFKLIRKLYPPKENHEA